MYLTRSFLCVRIYYSRLDTIYRLKILRNCQSVNISSQNEES